MFPLRLTGVRAAMGPVGSVVFTDKRGTVVGAIGGVMEDSKVDPRSGDGAISKGVTYHLVSVAGQPALRVTLDKAWLNDPACRHAH
jgi:hypothetical protein